MCGSTLTSPGGDDPTELDPAFLFTQRSPVPAKQVRIHDKLFPTKSAATNAIRSILYRYQPGEPINDADSFFLLGVLALHPHAALKVGCGVASFTVAQYEWSRGFALTRLDGTKTDWSYVVCLTPPTPAKEAAKGFRTEIQEQIKDFRCEFFRRNASPVCPILQTPLVNDLSTHVDHDPPFDELLRNFMALRSLTLDTVEVNASQDNDLDTRLLDRRLAEDWQRYHREHAGLRVVSKRANLSNLRRKA